MSEGPPKTYTSASRLIAEAVRARELLIPNEAPLFNFLEPWLGGGHVHWSRGLIALRKTLDVAEGDLEVLSASRRPKYAEEIDSFRKLTDPSHFSRASNKIVSSTLTDGFFDRMDSLDEHLLQAGRQYSIDQQNAAFVSGEISSLIDEISVWPDSDLGDILIDRLEELDFVISRYDLFGADGARNAVERLIGSVSVFGASNSVSDDGRAAIKRAFTAAKGVMDVLVYGQAGYEALVWSGSGIKALITSVSS